MDPFLAPVVVAAKARGVVDAVAEAVDRIAMAGAGVGLVAVVERTVASDSRHDQAVKATESGVVAKEWPDAKVVSVHKQLGRASSGTVEVVAADSAVSVPGFGRLRGYCSGRS